VRSRPATRLRPRPSVTEKSEFIDAEYAMYLESGERYVPSVVKTCRWMEVSRSGFYDSRNAPGIGDGEKARDARVVCAEVIR
jgi:hypothetical protein